MDRFLSTFFTPEVAEKAGVIPGDIPLSLPADPLVTGLEYDSRKVQPGSLYFALKGFHADGHRYIGEAIDKGAQVIVHDREITAYDSRAVYIRVRDSRVSMSPIAASFYGYPSQRIVCIGVTGTEGKSTTVYLIWQFLKLMGKKAGFFSTVHYSLGGEAQPNAEHQTTPEATEVQRLLWEMAEGGAEYAVVEASSHGLSKKTNRLGDVVFSAGVMTNVTHEHLEFHGTWEQYRDDKANLFRALKRQGVLAPFGVLNADDPSASYFAAAAEGGKILKFSTRGLVADLTLGSLNAGTGGNWYHAAVRQTGEFIDIRDRLPGTFNAGNVLAALLVVSELLDVSIRDLAPLVARLQPLRGRMTEIPNTLGIELLVDYAHTPSSFQTSFPPLRERLEKGKRIITVFGSAGERDTKKRAQQGEIAARYSDIVILCDEDPRGEDPLIILEEIANGCTQGNPNLRRGRNLFLIPDRPSAIRKALSLAKSGDMVLLLGKGHENSIIYADGPHPYDEIEEARKAVGEMERE
jgi:UDP-N-acetylmuramoyl-L-alanyl-D-glutamate--2,6-diaminopimelate ligase